MSLRDHCISGGDAGTDILDTVPSEFAPVLSVRCLCAVLDGE